jgi:hypothetical protein
MRLVYTFVFASLWLTSINCSAQEAKCIVDIVNGSAAKLSLKTPTVGDLSLSGTLSPAPTDPTKITFTLCINDTPVPLKSSGLNSKGTFTIPVPASLRENDQISLQSSEEGPPQLEGSAVKVTVVQSPYNYLFIAGVEQSGFSSLSLSTEPFIQFYIEGLDHHPPKISHLYYGPWGKVRLLGAPAPSTNGIASSFTDPTGTITKQDFTKVGQSLDVVAGGQIYLRGESSTHARAALIAWGGTTTTLSSQNVAYTFKVPAVKTAECQQLLSRFTPATGYSPGLTADLSGNTCVVNGTTPVTDIAFANPDRSNFLAKWGVGFRAVGTENCTSSRKTCLGALSILDTTIGQDAVVTGGRVRHFVVKVDGLLALPGTSSSIYLFGSVYTRITRNQESAPLILAAETTQPSLPNPAVVVLPLRQPDRDYFRLGVGVNLSQVMSKLFSSM